MTVNPSGGFTGSVNLSVSGLPSGATGSFSPNPTTSTSTLTVTTSSTTPLGTSTLTVTGTSGSLSHTTTATLAVQTGSSTNATLVQTGTFQAPGSGSVTVTLPAASAAGNLLVATVSTGASTFTGPTGWVKATAVSNTTSDVELWYYPNNPGGITSATFSSGGTFSRGQMSEWHGLSATAPLDQTGSATAASVTSVSVSTAGATVSSGELAITAFEEDLGSANSMTFTPGTGWTNMGNNASASARWHATFDYKNGNAIGTISETETSSVSGSWVAVIATFKS